jgi:hypothetical protein
MSVVHIPRAVRDGDIPAICVATGATEGARFRSMTLQFVPLAARLALGFCGLVGIIVFLNMRQTAQLALPFTDAAWERYTWAKRVSIGLIIAAVAPLLVVFMPFARSVLALELAVAAFVVFVFAAVVHYLTVIRHCAPICTDISADYVALDVPNDSAANAIRAKFDGALISRSTGAGHGERDTRDDELDRELRDL